MRFSDLQEEYSKRGISLVCARNRQKYYLTIKAAPTTVIGAPVGVCQLTGYYIVYMRERLLDIEAMVKEVFDEYRKIYANNQAMLDCIN